MTAPARFLAVDLGASSGRAMVCNWSGECFELEELHRFPNRGVPVGCDLYWDALGLWQHLLDSLMKHRAAFGQPPAGIAIDAWGVRPKSRESSSRSSAPRASTCAAPILIWITGRPSAYSFLTVCAASQATHRTPVMPLS